MPANRKKIQLILRTHPPSGLFPGDLPLSNSVFVRPRVVGSRIIVGNLNVFRGSGKEENTSKIVCLVCIYIEIFLVFARLCQMYVGYVYGCRDGGIYVMCIPYDPISATTRDASLTFVLFSNVQSLILMFFVLHTQRTRTDKQCEAEKESQGGRGCARG